MCIWRGVTFQLWATALPKVEEEDDDLYSTGVQPMPKKRVLYLSSNSQWQSNDTFNRWSYDIKSFLSQTVSLITFSWSSVIQIFDYKDSISHYLNFKAKSHNSKVKVCVLPARVSALRYLKAYLSYFLTKSLQTLSDNFPCLGTLITGAIIWRCVQDEPSLMWKKTFSLCSRTDRIQPLAQTQQQL